MNRYVLYARKSHTDESRQQKSIEDQVQAMTDYAERAGLTVVRVLREERSAKEPYERPLFDEMVRLLEQGEADGILAYHVNRIARNMVEGGLLQHLLTKRMIREIRTPGEAFRSGDNILPFVLQAAMSTQYSLDLSAVVRERVAAKVARGECPHRAPEGYLNNPFLHAIEKDEKRFPLIRQAWELMATGTYSLERLAKLMNDEWGYRTRRARKTGGGPISKTVLHRIFHNVFYTGHFLHKGELHRGVHEPMVSWETFEAVQRVLGRQGQTRAHRREFAYTGLIVCGACGRRITAEHHRGRHGRGDYTYYHCSDWRHCGQRAVREEVVEAEIASCLSRVSVCPDLRPLCIEAVERAYREEAEKDHARIEQQHRALEEAERRMSRLVQMGLKGLLSDEEFAREKATILAETNGLKGAAARAQGALTSARAGALAVAEFVTSAPYEFAAGGPAKKKEIARRLGTVFELRDGTVSVALHPLLVPFVEGSRTSAVPPDVVSKDGERRNVSVNVSVIEPPEIGFQSGKAAPERAAVPLGCEDGTKIETLCRVFSMLLDGVHCLA